MARRLFGASSAMQRQRLGQLLPADPLDSLRVHYT
jgi:hypothetical protein